MVLNIAYSTTSSSNSTIASSTSSTSTSDDAITARQSYEATHGIVELVSAVENMNKPPESSTSTTTASTTTTTSMSEAFLASADYRPLPATPFGRPRRESRPVLVSRSQISFDHADANLEEDTDYNQLLHRIRLAHGKVSVAGAAATSDGEAPLPPQQQKQQEHLCVSTSIVAREQLRFKVNRGECIVGSPENAGLLEPHVLAACLSEPHFFGGDGTASKMNPAPSTSTSFNLDAISLSNGMDNSFDFGYDLVEVIDKNEGGDKIEDTVSESHSDANNPDHDGEDDGLIFPLEDMDVEDLTDSSPNSEDVQQYQSIFTLLEDDPEYRLETIRQVAAQLRQISANFAATRPGRGSAAAAQSTWSTSIESFSSRCANLLVHFFRTLQTLTLRQLNWLLNW